MKGKCNLTFIFVTAASCLCLCLYAVLKSSNYGKNTNNMLIHISTGTTQTTEEHNETKTETVKATDINIEEEYEDKGDSEALTERLYLNINTASETELVQLDGIGEELAGRITEYRENTGEFRNIEELMQVRGIGEKKFEAIRNYIYVENPVYLTETEPATENISEEIKTGESTTEESTTETTTEKATEPVTEETEASTEIITETTTTISLEDIAPIDINKATKEELMLLPHVDEEVAEAILKLREEINGYSHPYELLYIEELEQKEVAEIVEFVTVSE